MQLRADVLENDKIQDNASFIVTDKAFNLTKGASLLPPGYKNVIAGNEGASLKVNTSAPLRKHRKLISYIESDATTLATASHEGQRVQKRMPTLRSTGKKIKPVSPAWLLLHAGILHFLHLLVQQEQHSDQILQVSVIRSENYVITDNIVVLCWNDFNDI